MIKDFGFIIPQNCQFGMGALKKLPDFLKAAGSDNVMLISDRGLEAIGVVDKVREIIKGANLKYSEYLDVLPNPTTTIVDECARTVQGCWLHRHHRSGRRLPHGRCQGCGRCC